MSDPEAWLKNNDEYLAAAVAWIYLRLQRLAGVPMADSQPPVSRSEPEPSRADEPVTPPTGAQAPGDAPTGAASAGGSWLAHLLRERPAGQPIPPTAPMTPFPAAAPESAPPPEPRPAPLVPVGADDPMAEAWQRMQAAAAASQPPAGVWLQQALRLSDFELHTLLLCAAIELDTRTATLCSLAQGDPTGANLAYPTFALAMALFDAPAWDVLSPERPLRYWRLVEPTQQPFQGLTISPLRADERIVNFLKGLNYLDDRLAPYFMVMLSLEQLAEFQVTAAGTGAGETPLPGAMPVHLSPSQAALAGEIAFRLVAGRQPLAATSESGMFAPQRAHLRLPLVQLTGPAGEDKSLVAIEVARQLGCGLYRLPAAALPAQPADLDNLARLWRRETALLPFGLYVDTGDTGLDPAATSLVERLLSRLDGLAFIACREPWPGLDPDALIVEVERATPAEQAGAWAAALPNEQGDIPYRLANQFSLGLPEISGIAARQLALDQADLDGLWRACLERSRPRLDLLAERVEPRSGWDDLVLPDDARRLLQEIAAQVDQRSTVYEDWGFRQKMSRGLGISALFAGESGVGKTMAAEVIAKELNLNLYRIDLSAVVSKYIGETEKNLRRLFDAAGGGGAILFFDEADALFGKRSEVKDSHDRYANIEINYLLQRMEAYTGLAILATNMKSALDPAFTRRLRFIVTFPVPGPAERKLIWQKVFPADTPLELADPATKIDYDRLAKVTLNGGGIRNAALNAAFRAAAARSKVTMPLLIEAIQTELKKSDRMYIPV
jgi:hypothetical protein